MKQYKYKYYINNIEVTRNEFVNKLNIIYTKCDTNYSNPLLNISYTDEKLVKSKLRYFQTHPNFTLVLVGSRLSLHVSRTK